METDPQIGNDVDPHEQARSENEEIEKNAKAAEGKEPEEKAAAENVDLYEPDARKSVVVPGTDGTLSGTAFTEWVDDDGNLAEGHDNPVDVPDLPSPEEKSQEQSSSDQSSQDQSSTEQSQEQTPTDTSETSGTPAPPQEPPAAPEPPDE